jgi:hypothetical protein
MIRHLRVVAVLAAASSVDASAASAAPVFRSSQELLPRLGIAGRAIEPPGPLRPRVQITNADRLRAAAAGWQRVAATPPFGSAGEAMLMTDGTVFVYDNSGNWFTLTPDKFGNYVNGTWSQKASLPAGYAPLYFGSAVLPTGDVIVEGGEYNEGGSKPVWTSLGAYYNRKANTWSAVNPPAGWTSIGDAPSVVLPNGTFMLGNCCSVQQALFNPSTKAWTATGAGKADSNNEEGWTLLPSGNVLTADVGDAPNSELYNSAGGTWSSAGILPELLTGKAYGDEMGPQVLRPDGTVFTGGADQYTAIYHTSTGAWSAGPNFPIIGGAQLDMADAPASLLPNGNVLMAVSPGVFKQPSYFLNFNGTKFTEVAGPPNAPNDSSFYYKMLLLPTGQVLETDFSTDVEIYTPQGKPYAGIAPVITSVPQTLKHGKTYKASGVLFNGVSQANAYGDDAQAATNFPLIAITNAASGHVVFARTHAFSSMAVASPAVVSTLFDVPTSIETGASTLVVVANGIQSQPVAVTIE